MAAELASAERLDIEQHLAGCSACRHMMCEILDESSTDHPAPRFHPRVLGAEMVLADRYRIRRFLGMGAMGEVHEADDLLLGKTVAVKTLNARLLGSERAIARLKLEVAAAHRVTHPNVCRIFDLGIDCRDQALGALMFITMERLEGPTLAALLPDPALGDGARTEILRQLAAGLAAAHAAGVIHRDLKPENVMVTRQDDGALRAVITDFGLAGLGGSTDAPAGTGLSGTPAYAAPERMRGAPATPASDVYSLGLIAYETLSRRRLLGATPDLRALPQDWRAPVARALENDPSLRPADAARLLETIDPKAGGRRPHRVWFVGAVAAAALALALVAATARVAPEAVRSAPSPVPPSLPTATLAPIDVPAPLPVPFAKSPPFGAVKRRSPARAHALAALPPASARAPGPVMQPTARPDRLVRDVPFDPPPGSRAADLVNPF